MDNYFKDNPAYNKIATHANHFEAKLGCTLFPSFCTMLDEMKKSAKNADLSDSLRKAKSHS